MKLTAKDVMNADVISVRTDMDLRDLAKLFLDKGITGAPVVDTRGNLAGVISQTDLVYYSMTRGDELVLDTQFYHHARFEGRHLPQGFQVEDFNSGTVADVMTPVVHSVSERAGLQSVARLMTREHIHRVIVRRGQKVAGVISALDMLNATTKAATPAKKSTRRPAVPTRTRAASGSRSRSSAGRKTPVSRADKKKRPARRRTATTRS